MLQEKEIFKKMNDLGAAQIPFLFVIDFLKQNGLVVPLNQLNGEISFSFHKPPLHLDKEIKLEKNPFSFSVYKEKFDLSLRQMSDQKVSLINLTCPTPIQTDLSLDEIFNYADAAYKLLWKDRFVCFSPETFVRIKDGFIYSYPMKGTIDAAESEAEKKVLSNPKELDEHTDAVNLIIKDLQKVSESVKVNKFRYINKISAGDKELLQVSSEISGKLSENYPSTLGDIFDALLPAGSICGTPKNSALEIIENVEQYRRNFYSGVFGIFDGQNLDSGVLIRFIENTANGLVYKSGGGITQNSIAEKEYAEMITKIYVPVH